MNTNQSDLPVLPTRAPERIAGIDVLRGIALMGILIVNIFYFCAPDPFYEAYFNSFQSPPDDLIFHAVNFFFSGRFYPIFSFLFGFGFFIQFTRLRQKGFAAKKFFARRLTILLIFGVLHVLFVWEEEILLFYALFGFVLILIAERPPRTILFFAAAAYALPVLMQMLNGLYAFLPPKYVLFHSMAEYTAFYTSASYGQILAARLALYADKIFTIGGFIHHFDRLAFFFAGFYAAKTNWLADISAHGGFWIRAWMLAFVFGVIFHALWIVYIEKPALAPAPLSVFVISMLLPFQVFSYICGILLLLKIKGIQNILHVFAAPGRMALTNYIMGTTVFSFLFYSYGLGLYGSLSPSQLMGIALAFFAFQVVFSNIWLKKFLYGPLEWIWRSLTYKSVLPIRIPLVS